METNPTKELVENMSVKDWILVFFLALIPFVNIVLLLMWAFGENQNPVKKNYAKAQLLLALILSVIIGVFFAIFGTAMIASGAFDELESYEEEYQYEEEAESLEQQLEESIERLEQIEATE